MDTTRVGQILRQQGTVALPGVYDTLSAKICEKAGFPMTFISGYSVAATAIGEPDLGLLTQTEITDRARRICMSFEQFNDLIGVDDRIALAERFGVES
ncbi:MAG: hypothetical protein GXX96_26470 [Planctomycetaceae bacterium]|nr:hypothetical protein [Planctomycetaceae bacterium]